MSENKNSFVNIEFEDGNAKVSYNFNEGVEVTLALKIMMEIASNATDLSIGELLEVINGESED